MKKLVLIISLLIAITLRLSAQYLLNETTLDTTTIITGLDIPWEIQWGPDNFIWCTERFGRISRVNPETGEQNIILDISDIVEQNGESGLLGMALHPDFDNNPFVYMAYTYQPPGKAFSEKIVRYEYVDNVLQNEFVLLDGIPANTSHNGCRMIILPDTTLLFSTGDAQNQSTPQDTSLLSGKFLRLNLDGTIPVDNPFAGNPVFSFGHRNPQGLLIAPNGIIYSSEHGPSTDDEVNIIMPGRNYGWPDVHGFCDLPDEMDFCEAHDVVEPLTAWTPTIATSDILYYNHPAIPEWQDHILLTTLKNKRVYVLELNEDGTEIIGEEQFFTNWWGRLRDICMSPDGAIYLATNGPDWGNSEPFTHSIVKVWNPDYVSINESEDANNDMMKIFPNPASDLINIKIDSEYLGTKLRIFSVFGDLVVNRIVDSTHMQIHTGKLSPGLFTVWLESKGEIINTQKFLIIND